LNDISRYYKSNEQSGPGDPSLPACEVGATQADHTACSGPNLNQKPDERRGRRAVGIIISNNGNDGADTATTVLTFPQGLGVHPPGPIVNEAGNAYSGITLGLPIGNTDLESDMVVTCRFYIHVKDYRGHPYVNGSVGLSAVAVSDPIIVTVPAAGSASCEFVADRSVYSRFAATTFDVAVGTHSTAMEPDEKAFMLETSVVARGENGEVFEGSLRKLICTPLISSRGSIVCEAGRGVFAAPNDNAAVAHLKTCTGMSSIVNDGKCHESKNNIDNCWDVR
jgi:hypothetical protein